MKAHLETGLERARVHTRIGAEQLVSHVSDLFIFSVSLPPSLDSRLSTPDHRCLLNHWHKIPARNHTPSCPHSPAFPFPFTFSLFFFVLWAMTIYTLAAAMRHQYTFNSVLVSLFSFLLTFFLQFSYPSGTTTTRISTP